jgi:hypothetical protein
VEPSFASIPPPDANDDDDAGRPSPPKRAKVCCADNEHGRTLIFLLSQQFIWLSHDPILSIADRFFSSNSQEAILSRPWYAALCSLLLEWSLTWFLFSLVSSSSSP